jgi:cytochrome c oxidase assembly protein subunit 11
MSEDRRKQEIDTRTLTLRLFVLAVAMFGFGFLLVPLYDVFCEVTGLGGKTDDTAATDIVAVADESREVRLEFLTMVNQYAPWEFEAELDGMTVHPGGLYEAWFVATNLTNSHKVAQAVPSVAPAEGAAHFRKLDCFCFSNQAFEPGERKRMPVRFVIDSDLPDYIDTLTLSYTFFDTARPGDADHGVEHTDHTSR